MTSVTVVVPMAIRRRGGRKQILGPDGAPVRLGGEVTAETRGDPVLVKALARAFRWRRMLEEGRYTSLRELARAEGIDRGFVGKILQLTLLPPHLVEAILDGRHREGITLPGLMAGTPVVWAIADADAGAQGRLRMILTSAMPEHDLREAVLGTVDWEEERGYRRG